MLRQWQRWKSRSDPAKQQAAARLLSTYLSLSDRGLDPGTVLKFKFKKGRKILACGNNRIRLLSAMGCCDLDVVVSDPAG